MTAVREPEAPATAAPHRTQAWRVVGALVLVGLAVAGLVTQRSLVVDASQLLLALPLLTVAALLGVWGVHTLVHGWAQAKALPGATLGQGVVAAETQSAASHALVGGGTIGTGVRMAMFRSWGHGLDAATVAVAASAVATGTAMWLMPVLVLLPLLLAGAAPAGSGYVVAGAAAVLVATTAGWVVLVHHPGLARRLGCTTDRLLAPARRRWPALPEATVLFEQARHRSRALLRRHALPLLGASLLHQLTLALVLVACVWAVGVPGVSVGETLVLMAVVKVAASLVPLPGGIGVVDLGLLAALTRAGAPETEAAAAVLAFRGLTYVLPILTGAAAVVWWRSRRSRRRSTPAPTGADAYSSP